MPFFSLQGQTLGKYRILDRLGRGGMAQVYRAYHPQLDRYVAIKVLRSDLLEDDEFLTRFRREARAVAALRHANIVQVYDFDVQDDVYYMVMELLEGDTLKARLNDYRSREEQMPWGEVVRVLLDVLDGLAYAHSEGMIHRDIKPANIMLTKRGQAVIADFGIAQIIGGTRHTVSGALMGTLNYIAPEQGLKGHCDARSDIYSLGIVFYEMLTWSTPFDADTPLAILMKHLNDPLPRPRDIDPTIPEPFEQIVLKALAKNPEERYQSVEEMAQALYEATKEAEIELPARISLPLSFMTAEAPSEPVSIYSGAARSEIADARFADDDTDAALIRRLAAYTVRAAREWPRSEFLVGTSETGRSLTRRDVWRVILSAVGLLVACNMAAVMAEGMTGLGGIFRKGWPMELLLVGLGLCAIMNVTSSVWLLIPVGIVLGNGVVFSYYTLSGNWQDWSFLWPMEPLLVVGTVVLTFWLAGHGDLTRRVSRLLGGVLGLVAFGLSLIVAIGAMIA